MKSMIVSLGISSVVGPFWLAVMLFCGVPAFPASCVAAASIVGVAVLVFSISGGNDRP